MSNNHTNGQKNGKNNGGDEQCLRSPICVVVGHVDHGKTSLLDKIRGSTITLKEPGAITQTISSTFVPKDVLEKLCGKLLEKFRFEITVPGLLFIDTPGHEAFTTLRKRGGNIADLAILMVDIIEGIMPQTIESIEMLRNEKTPFVVAVNKIDRIQGWKSDSSFLENFDNQSDVTKKLFEERFYSIIAQLSAHGFSADRFDQVSDFRKTIATVPISGKTGEGIPDLLAILVGLSQQFLRNKLQLTKRAKGNILEVKETFGLGTTIDVILYDGVLKKGDYIVIGGKNPFITKVKALFLPEPMSDIRLEKKFCSVDQCCAACGVKVSAPNLSDVVAGSPITATQNTSEAEEILAQFQHEKEETEIVTEAEGILLKADTLGSLEALINIFRKYQIREARIGNITKEDVIHAEINKDWANKIIIGFNVRASDEAKQLAKENDVKILESNIIYHLVEDYEKWVQEKREELLQKQVDVLTRPGRIAILPGCTFRASNPAIVGCDVSGLIKPGYNLLKVDEKTREIKLIGEIKQIQKEGQDIPEAKSGDRVAISIPGPVVGRQISEGDTLYADISSDEYKKLNHFLRFLSESEKSILQEIFLIKRKSDPSYGL